MLKSNPKSKTGETDPFDKAKLAKEAKQDQEKLKEAKRQQDRSKLQLQISNRERELVKLESDLRVKESFLAEVKRKAEEAKKAVFLLGGQIKKEEGEIGYLEARVSSTDDREYNLKTELEKTQREIDSIQREKAALEARYTNGLGELRDLKSRAGQVESDYNSEERNLKDLEQKISQLRAELDRAIAEADALRKKTGGNENDKVVYEAEALEKELAKYETDIRALNSQSDKLEQTLKGLEMGGGQTSAGGSRLVKTVQGKRKEIKEERQDLFLRKRVAEQLERDLLTATQVLTKLNRDKTAKEREIADLKRERDQI